MGVLLLIILSGCQVPSSHSNSPKTTMPDSSKKETVFVERGDRDNSVQLMVREYLQGGEDTDFGYFVYLIFAEPSQVTYAKRLAAAQSFICQYSNLLEARDIGLTKSDFAVFYAPVKRNTNIAHLERSKSAKTLLKEYDYAGASFLLRQLSSRSTSEENLNGITLGIIGSPVPLMTRMAEIEMKDIQVLNLEESNPYQVSQKIREFRTGLLTGGFAMQEVQENGSPNLAMFVQQHFSTVRSMDIPVRPQYEDGPHACL